MVVLEVDRYLTGMVDLEVEVRVQDQVMEQERRTPIKAGMDRMTLPMTRADKRTEKVEMEVGGSMEDIRILVMVDSRV